MLAYVICCWLFGCCVYLVWFHLLFVLVIVVWFNVCYGCLLVGVVYFVCLFRYTCVCLCVDLLLQCLGFVGLLFLCLVVCACSWCLFILVVYDYLLLV